MAPGDLLWTPPADVWETSRIGDFTRALPHRFEDYPQLWNWSVEDLAGFWEAIWNYFDVIGHSPYQHVLEGDQMPGVRWFPGATLNYAEHVLRAGGLSPTDTVLVARSQTRSPMELTVEQLRDQVARARAGLLRLGVERGDRVAKYLHGQGPAVLKAMDAVADESGATLAQIALAWLTAQPGVVAPIASATSAAQLHETLKAMTLTLTADQLERLDAAGA